MLDLSDKNMTTTGVSNTDTDQLGCSAVIPPKIGYRYRHYKGGLYRVEGFCTIESSREPAVLYRALDPCASQDLWMRPLSMFTGSVSAGPRFAEVHEPSVEALIRYLPESLVPSAVLDHILAHYDSPGRFFHARWQVYDLFEKASILDMELLPEQVIALLFKDIVLVPGVTEGVNERLSSLYLRNLADSLGKFRLDVTCRIIEDMARRKPTIVESETVLDLAMAHLADETTEFCAYDELVWLETRHLLDTTDARKDFDTRRLKYLLGLAERGPIFCQSRMAELEKKARENLENFRLAWVTKYSPSKAD